MQDIRIKFYTDVKELEKANYFLDKLTNEEKDLVKQLAAVQSQAKKTNDELANGGKKANDSLAGINGTLGNVGSAIAGAFAVERILAFGSKIIEVTSQFQKLQAVLTNALGSESAGQVAFAKIQDFAAKTNFSVLELTESFVKLKGSGFEPTTAELTKLADLANSKAKSFDQLAEAVIDAQTGEFERLKEFGVLASKSGDQVTFTFNEQKTVVKNTASEIRKYVTSLGELEGVAGSTAAISATLSGRISNLGDATDNLLNTLGNAGAGGFADFLGFITAAINGIEKLIAGEEELIKREGLRQQSKVAEEYANAIQQLAKDYEALGFSADEANQKAQKFFADQATNSLKDLYQQLRDLETTITKVKAVTEESIFGDLSGELEKLEVRKQQILSQIGIQRQYLDSQDKINEKAVTTVELTKDQIKALEDAKKALEDFRKEYEKIVAAAENVLRSDLERIVFEFEKTTARLSELGSKIEVNKEKLAADLKTVTDAFEKQFRKALNKVDVIEQLVPLEKTKEQLDKEKKLRDKYNADRIAKTTEATETELDALRAQSEKKRKLWKEDEEFRQMVTQESFDLTSDLSNAFFEVQQSRYANDLAAVQKAEENKLAIVGDNAQAQAFIRESADRQEKEIRLRQAKAERAQALFNIGINTAQAILKAAATFPFPANLVPIAFATAAGALQTAVVLSKPLPAFRKGVIDLNGPGDGQSDSIVARLSKGESVMTDQETKDFKPALMAIRNGMVRPELLNAAALGRISPGAMVQNPEQKALRVEFESLSKKHDALLHETQKLRGDIKNLTLYHVSIDEKGFNKSVRKGNYTAHILNDQFR